MHSLLLLYKLGAPSVRSDAFSYCSLSIIVCIIKCILNIENLGVKSNQNVLVDLNALVF